MKKIIIILSAFTLFACGTQKKGMFETEKSQVHLRSMQSRSFDTSDKEKVMRGVISTLQDLSFVIDHADFDIGTVKATKLSGYNLTMSVSVRPKNKMSVSVRPKNKQQMLVRANARYNTTVVDDPKPYQDFFTSLSKGLFLDANLEN